MVSHCQNLVNLDPLVFSAGNWLVYNLGVHFGRKSGLRPVRLTYTGECLICRDNFTEHNMLGDGNCFFRTIPYLLLGQEVKHDVIRARIVYYIMDSNNIDKLRSYIPHHYPSGEAYIQGEAMADLTTWAKLRWNCLPVHSYLAKISCATVIGHGSGTLLVETQGNQ